MLAKTKKTLEWAIFSFLGLIIVVCGSLFFYQVAYANKIYRNVYVAGIDMSGKSKSQVASLISKKFNEELDKDVILKAGDKELKTKVSDTGLSLDVNKIAILCYEAGRDDNFFDQLISSAKTLRIKMNVQVETQIDQEKYANFIAIAVAQFNSDPVNASLTINSGQIKEVAEQEGSVVDTSSLPEKILRLSDTESERTILLDIEKTTPRIKVADFTEAKSTAENILSKKIQLTYEDKLYSPSRAEIGNWIVFSEKSGKLETTISDGNVQAYLNKIAINFEISKKDRKINAVDGSIIDQGQEGKLLDKKSAIALIKSKLNNTGDAQIALVTYMEAPKEVKIFPSEGLVPGRFAGKYVDVDLTLQKLCRIESTSIVDCFTISSGKPGMNTPTGTYTISEKNPRHWSATYSMWLPYWQRFHGPYGLHELPETNTWKETDAHLGTPVSHGCVRLGVGPAQILYDWTEVGTTVYVHK